MPAHKTGCSIPSRWDSGVRKPTATIMNPA